MTSHLNRHFYFHITDAIPQYTHSLWCGDSNGLTLPCEVEDAGHLKGRFNYTSIDFYTQLLGHLHLGTWHLKSETLGPGEGVGSSGIVVYLEGEAILLATCLGQSVFTSSLKIEEISIKGAIVWVTKDDTHTRSILTPRAALMLRLHTPLSRWAGLVEVLARQCVARHSTVSTCTRSTLVSLPLFTIIVDHAMHVACTLQLSCCAAAGATLILLCNLVLLRAVEDRTGGSLAGDVAFMTGAGGTGVKSPFHTCRIQVPVQETSTSWWGDQFS